MQLIIFKGFGQEFLADKMDTALLSTTVKEKTDILAFTKSMRKQLNMALIQMEDNDEKWITYEEYSLIKNQVADAIKEDNLKVILYRNNLYPDYYPLPFTLADALADEISRLLSGENVMNISEDCHKFTLVYNALINIDGVYYGSFCNYEYDKDENIFVKDYYPKVIEITEEASGGEFNIFLNDDINTYLRDLTHIMKEKPSVLGISSTWGQVSRRTQDSLQAYCVENNIRMVKFHEILPIDQAMEQELIDIAQNDIGIKEFKSFRQLKFYKNPDISKEVIELSQGQIIQEIICQAEKSYDSDSPHAFRDIFITASTGAGKSVMFQVPAVYLAKKHKKLTIIIEPVKALMQDQKEKLNKNGYMRVETFNSDLISQVEKEAVLERIKSGEVDLLYLSPETLLSYSIETIIGEREIGLLIVDEAHIVTTWGVGFRPDYWYLGGYINRLRNQIQTQKGMQRKVYHFPICAFTATAINGGIDDSVGDTIISLYMENPIKYIGYVRRDDIHFDINHMEEKKRLSKNEYEQEKAKALYARMNGWLAKNEKTIVYFPYASFACDAAKGIRSFAGMKLNDGVGIYTGRNVDGYSQEAFNAAKKEAFDNFRNGSTPIMLATKAFGMGIDVSDVQNIYHYAVTGNLCDYVQEIGRAARKKSMTGVAIMDNYYRDINFMKSLFGMSQIKQYQIKAVLNGIYNAYKNNNEARNFLISPESFTYIFNGRGAEEEGKCINKLKTCLLMIEKDFYDKYNFKVLISRPQSVFTKAFVCIFKDDEQAVLSSRYGNCFKRISDGRQNELQRKNVTVSDMGDIYEIDLKEIWEKYYPDISFPQFKYWYFNANSEAKRKVDIMPEIRASIAPRQKVNIEAQNDLLLCDLRQAILDDFEFIADALYENFGKSFFTIDDMIKLLRERFGTINARIIANSLFSLVDPDGRCVKNRKNDSNGKVQYSLANGNLKEFMRNPIIKSNIVGQLSNMTDEYSYSGYISLTTDNNSTIALKLLSVFDYITYEVLGGSEPEIFIRLNDPNKLRSIVMGESKYSNQYVKKAAQKHERDIEVLLHFFNDIETDEERWDYIENYFLGYDVLQNVKPRNISPVKMTKLVDKDNSYQATKFTNWNDIEAALDKSFLDIVQQLAANEIAMPEYLQTKIKKSEVGDSIIMSWPTKNTLICADNTLEEALEFFRKRGWQALKIGNINYESLKEVLR